MTPTHSLNPETRSSLLLRVGDAQDQSAWAEFVDLYFPVIFRTAKLKGLQDADAHDVAQSVLVKVSGALSLRPHDSSRARFRTWLSTVTRNEAINTLRRWRLERGTGDSSVQEQLNQIAADEEDQALLETQYQKELFRVAAREIEAEFEADTWQCFWQTAIVGRPIAQVAKALAKQPGSVYAARSRIIRRLRDEVSRLQSEL